GDDAAHDLARPRLGHVRDDPDVLRPGDLADLHLDRLADLSLHAIAGDTGLERDVHLDDPAPDVIDHWHGGRLGDLGHGQRRRFELLRAEPVAGDVDHVVDAAEDPEVAVGRLERAVAGEVGPVVPVLAVRVPVVLGVVHIDEPLGLSPDRLHDSGPRVLDANVARAAAARRDLVRVLVVDRREDTERARAAAAGLHR